MQQHMVSKTVVGGTKYALMSEAIGGASHNCALMGGHWHPVRHLWLPLPEASGALPLPLLDFLVEVEMFWYCLHLAVVP